MSVIGEQAARKAHVVDWTTAVALISAPFWTDPLGYTLRTIILLIGIAIGSLRLWRMLRKRYRDR
jgi:hypothetical protein